MIKVFAQTDAGKVRSGNEDNFLVGIHTSTFADNLLGILPFDIFTAPLILMVSDGMGGAAAGEVASQIAVETVGRSMNPHVLNTAEALVEQMVEALRSANRAITKRSRQFPEMTGMGATATAAVLYQQHAFLGQIGDSRAYLIRGDQIVQLTKDQSLVNQLVEAGRISEEEARVHPRKNIILQALGSQEALHVATAKLEICRGDYLLLCSDGLSGMLSDDDLLAVIRRNDEVDAACRELVKLANQNGGIDNITVVLAEMSDDNLPEPLPNSQLELEILTDFSNPHLLG